MGSSNESVTHTILVNAEALGVFDFEIEVDIDYTEHYYRATYDEPGEHTFEFDGCSVDDKVLEAKMAEFVQMMHESDEPGFTLDKAAMLDAIAEAAEEWLIDTRAGMN